MFPVLFLLTQHNFMTTLQMKSKHRLGEFNE